MPPFDISFKTLAKITVFLLILWFLYAIRDIIFIFFIAIFLASLIDPFADWFMRRRIHRGVSVLILYVVLIAIVSLVSVVLAPPLVEEAKELVSSFPELQERAKQTLGSLQIFAKDFGILDNLEQGARALESVFTDVPGIFRHITGFFGTLISIVLVLVITFYMVVQEEQVKRFIRAVAPDKYQPFINQYMSHMKQKLGAWIRGQLILSIIVAMLIYIGLSILGVKYALVLAILAGLFEMVPYAGPVLSAIPAVILGFLTSTTTGVFVLVLFVVVQQLENHVLVPKVMQKVVGLNPLVSILAILVGARLAGVVGALLAIPVATAVMVFIQEINGREFFDS